MYLGLRQIDIVLITNSMKILVKTMKKKNKRTAL